MVSGFLVQSKLPPENIIEFEKLSNNKNITATENGNEGTFKTD